jgi:PhnB protein
MRFVPYLAFNGDCREAFEFYAKVFEAPLGEMFTYGSMPDEMPVAPEVADRIMNVSLDVGGATIMGSDAPSPDPVKMEGLCVSIEIDDEVKARKIYDAFADGGTIVMPYGPTFWAKQFAMVTDKYGTPWMINCGLMGS